MKPIIRWVGGKTRLLADLKPYFPEGLIRYYEPFMGGGAVYFDIEHRCEFAQISDININLMDMYAGIKNNPLLVIEILKKISTASYDEIKHEFNNKPKIGQCRVAALFLMLNHMCFNGLYRTNKVGHFNVPIGKSSSGKPRDMVGFDYDSILHANARLRKTIIKAGSFEDTMHDAVVVPGRTLVFCDPPYLKEFSSYDKSPFGVLEHNRLAAMAHNLRGKGATVVVCGSNTASSYQVYGNPTKVITLKRTVGASNRGDATEALYVFSPRH